MQHLTTTALLARPHPIRLTLDRMDGCGALLAAMLLLSTSIGSAAQQVIAGPAGSGSFGRSVATLPNGNIVVTDPDFDAPGLIADVGAVYLYRPDGTLVSTLIGSTAGDHLGASSYSPSDSITVLSNGNYVVISHRWDNGVVVDAGAVTFGSAVSGVSGFVSASNSLVGSQAFDQVGFNGELYFGGQPFYNGVFALSNGNYLVRSALWRNGESANAGALTFGSGVSGISGVVSANNSLVGRTTDDGVGYGEVIELSNGNYVVPSPYWDNGIAIDAGAVTYGSGVSGISGQISASISLVGSTANDNVGGYGVTTLSNGNYVVHGPYWDNGAVIDAGAATFGSAVIGIRGVVSASNSLVGSTANDRVGGNGISALSNGNYVVSSSGWDHGAILDVGAVTFASGLSGIMGVVSASNSLTGSTAYDQVGNLGVRALSNGNFVVRSPSWDNGAVINAGAATFGSGVSGISGPVSASNSLIGSTADDQAGYFGITALSNGNYLVPSPHWDNGAIVNVGAVTFGSGVSGISGPISSSNSLVGSTENNFVGSGEIRPLSNGNYVVNSPGWDNGAVIDVGAVTFGSGASGISGVVSASNSLVGSTANDWVGNHRIAELSTGNYVVPNSYWDNGMVVDAGAVTFGSGLSGVSGAISASNSLVGTAAGDQVGTLYGIFALSTGNYLVSSRLWDNGAAVDAGAVTFGSGLNGISGAVSASNSLVGGKANDRVGGGFITRLSNGNYVVSSPGWDNGEIIDTGAATFGSGLSGISGVVSASNSLVGSTEKDSVGGNYIIPLNNDNYLVRSLDWDNGAISNAGAITLGLADGSVTGTVSETHSVLGLLELVPGYSPEPVYAYDAFRNLLAVGQPASNRVVLHSTGAATSISIISDTPDPSNSEPVTFIATVSAASGAPSDGQVTFRASGGETCVDATPSVSSATTAEFSCSIEFLRAGATTVIAEYTGSVQHAYSGSAPESHTADQVSNIFTDDFES